VPEPGTGYSVLLVCGAIFAAGGLLHGLKPVQKKRGA